MFQVPVFKLTYRLKPVFKSPVCFNHHLCVSITCVFQSTVFESPVFESPVFESPVFESPVFESPMFESSPVLYSSGQSPVAMSTLFQSLSYLRCQVTCLLKDNFCEDHVLVTCIPVTFTPQLWQEWCGFPCTKIEALHCDSSVALYIPSTHPTSIPPAYLLHTFSIPSAYLQHTINIPPTYLQHTINIPSTYLLDTIDIP